MSRSWIRAAALVLATAALVHVATVRAIPYAVMRFVSERIVARGAANAFVHVPPVTADVRVVVFPSPDLLYSFCVFDVSHRPLRIHAEVPKTYWSLAVYAANTDNVFVMNDREAEGGALDLLVSGPETPRPASVEGRWVRSPTSRGVVMIRTLVRRPEELDALVATQHRATCALQ